LLHVCVCMVILLNGHLKFLQKKWAKILSFFERYICAPTELYKTITF